MKEFSFVTKYPRSNTLLFIFFPDETPPNSKEVRIVVDESLPDFF